MFNMEKRYRNKIIIIIIIIIILCDERSLGKGNKLNILWL